MSPADTVTVVPASSMSSRPLSSIPVAVPTISESPGRIARTCVPMVVLTSR